MIQGRRLIQTWNGRSRTQFFFTMCNGQWKMIMVIFALGSEMQSWTFETKSLLSRNSHVDHSNLINGLPQIRNAGLNWFKRRSFHVLYRDANLWRPKIGRLSFFHYPSPHSKNWSSPQWEWLRTLYDFLHDVHTIKIRNHRFNARNNLCQWLNTSKNAPETVLRIRKIQVLS